MKISENELKKMVRDVTLKEVTNFWKRGVRLRSSREQECIYYTELPKKFKKLFRGSSSGDIKTALAKHYPDSVNADPGLLESFATLGLQYSYMIGIGCLQYYLLGRALGVLATILNATGYSEDGYDAAQGSKSGVPEVNFLSGIRDEAGMIARERGSTGFVNNFAYYSLPKLSKLGPDVDDIDALTADLARNQTMIDEIYALNESDFEQTFESICSILNISSSPSMEQLRGANLRKIAADQSGIDRLEKLAVASIIAALGEAKLNYSAAVSSNPGFGSLFDRFFADNNVV